MSEKFVNPEPWVRQEEYIPLLLTEWREIKTLLEDLFKKRDRKSAEVPMKKAIELFMEFLYWTNGIPAHLSRDKKNEMIKIHPVNVDERLEFVIKRPSLYHSYIQLSELMNEMEKLYMKHMALKRASKR